MTTAPEPEGLPYWEFTLGWRLRKSLEHAGLQAQQIADELEVSNSAVGRWTRDEVTPHPLFLQRWAEITKVDYGWLRSGVTPGLPKPRGGAGKRNTVNKMLDNQDDFLDGLLTACTPVAAGF